MTGDIDGNGNKVLFGNVYSQVSDLPSASTYHGMFAHVHATGKGYFAHAGNWVALANDTEKLNLSGGTMTGNLDVGGSVEFDSLSGTGSVSITDILDEDNMASNSATALATQQSIKAYTDTAVANLVDSSPASLDTLNELAAALGDDASFSTTITNSIATKLPLAGGTMTGNIAHAGNFTLDVGGTIKLDADDGNVKFSDGGTDYGQIQNGTGNQMVIQGYGSNQDMRFIVNDGGSNVDALVFDASAAGAATFNSTVTANNGINVDNISIDGTTIALSSGNLTLDVAGNINLDADGGSITLKDGGASFGTLFKSSNNLIIYSTISDGDIKFQGNDGGSDITALTLDMSNGGRANFNNDIGLIDNRGLKLGSGDDSVIYNDGSNTYIRNNTSNQDIIFQGNDDGSANTTALTLDMSDAGTAIFNHDIKLNDAGRLFLGTDNDAQIYNTGSHTYIQNYTSNQDIIFNGVDDGSSITALTLDMSSAGAATFNSSVSASGISQFADVNIPDNNAIRFGNGQDLQIYHDGSNSYIKNNTGWLNMPMGGFWSYYSK